MTILKSVQFSSLTQSCPTLCDPVNHSTPGLPVHHHLPEFTQTHLHRVSDAIQPSHPLSSPFPLPPIPPSIRVFSNDSALHMRWPKYQIAKTILKKKTKLEYSYFFISELTAKLCWSINMCCTSIRMDRN